MSAEKTYNGFSSFINQCIQTVASVIKVIIKRKGGSALPQAWSRTCIVLGNGPSLKTSLDKHADFFTQHPLVCVNSFSTTKEYTLLQPVYYVILDPGFWLSKSQVVTDTIECLQTKTTWPLYMLVPHAAKQSSHFRELEKHNSNIKINYFNYTVYKGFEGLGNWLFKKNLAMPQSQNVLVASLFLSVNIGFKEIYVFGADHSWHENLIVNEDNVLCFKDSHFYDDITQKPTYRPFYKGLHLKEVFTISEILMTFSKIFYGYEVINKYANHCNAKIYNASEVSFVDAFERIKIN